MNVTIQCNCTDDNGTVIDIVRWYDPDGTRLVSSQNMDSFNPNVPHFERVNGDNSNIILIIPTFSSPYDGTYTCGRLANNFKELESPTAAVTLNGELTQSVICIYIIV